MLRLSIDALHRAFLAKAVSPVDLCRVYLKRIRNLNSLNSYITVVDESELLRQATRSAERYAKGSPLSVIDGIPFSVKDNFCTKDLRTTCASRTLESFIPPYSATVVERCVQNGAIIIGKTNLDEFGMGSSTLESQFGPTYNPFNVFLRCSLNESQTKRNFADNDAGNSTEIRNWIDAQLQESSEPVKKLDESKLFVAGGSSGGSAVSVATQTCVFALATDTGGSARNPAAHCGVAALKPSYGSTSRHGLIALMTAFDTPSIIASTVSDLGIVHDLISGSDRHDATTYNFPEASVAKSTPETSLRIGVPVEFSVPALSEDVRGTWQRTIDLLANSKQFQFSIDKCSVPHLRYAANCYLVIMCCEVASNFARYDGVRYGYRATAAPAGHSADSHREFESFEEQLLATRADAFGDTVKGRIVAGNYFLLRENATRFYEQARKVNQLILADFERAFRDFDVLLTPTTPYPAPSVTEYRRGSASAGTDQTAKILSEDVCTVCANLCGLPAVSIPVAASSSNDRLPISMQLIGKRGSEHTLLRLAAFLEQQFGFYRLVQEMRPHSHG